MSNPNPHKIAGSNHLVFDPWNSSSSGHQHSESNPGTAWRRTREAKLAQQFRTGDCGIASFTYNGAERRYERGEWEWKVENHKGRGETSGKVGGRDSKQRDIRSMTRASKSGLSSSSSSSSTLEEGKKGLGTTKIETAQFQTSIPASIIESLPEHLECLEPGPVVFCTQQQQQQTSNPTTTTTTISTSSEPQLPTKPTAKPTTNSILKSSSSSPSESSILTGTTIYVNGQTTPLISDHKLKQLLVSHGATLALYLSRRVTHIIIGKPNQGPGRGAGGGLAGGKIQKEIKRGGWRAIRIVGPEWVLESVKAGKRLPETRFAINLSSQRSVVDFM